MKRSTVIPVIALLIVTLVACKKDTDTDTHQYQYYEVGFRSNTENWRDTSFVVRTYDAQIVQQADAQLLLPVNSRKLVVGTLMEGNGGYNKNGPHQFKWHLKEDDWQLADVTIEIYDGRPYSDVDVNLSYWLNTVKRFGPWGSYIKRKLPGKP